MLLKIKAICTFFTRLFTARIKKKIKIKIELVVNHKV